MSSELIGYVISIDALGGARRESMARELADVSFPWEIVQGVRKNDPVATGLYSKPKNLLFASRSLAPVEVAVYASHRRIWERLLASNARFGLVFEDDARIVDRAAFDRAIADALAAPSRWDILKFFDYRPKAVAIRSKIGATGIVSHRIIASSNACYLITREAAAKLLRRQSLFRPVDEDLSCAWEFGLRIWSISPNPVMEAREENGGSLVDQGRESKKVKSRGRSVIGVVLQAWKQFRTKLYHRWLARSAA